MVKVIRIVGDDIDTFWEVCREHIRMAMDHTFGEANTNDVYKDLKKKTKQLFIICNGKYDVLGSMVTMVAKYPNKRSIKVLYLGGKSILESHKDIVDFLLEFAKQKKADMIEVVGRKGWGKVLSGDNFKPKYFTYVREV